MCLTFVGLGVDKIKHNLAQFGPGQCDICQKFVLYRRFVTENVLYKTKKWLKWPKMAQAVRTTEFARGNRWSR